MNEMIVVSMEMAEVTKKRAEEAGFNYEETLKLCGVNKSVWDTARRTYRNNCSANGWDPNEQLVMLKPETYTRLCMGFAINADTYRVDEPKPAERPYKSDSDVAIAIESLKSQQEVTNHLLREIRSAISESNDKTGGKLDKIFARCQEIDSHTGHLIDIKKDVQTNRKATASIDQRLNGINQIFASHKIAVEKIRMMIERYVSGK